MKNHQTLFDLRYLLAGNLEGYPPGCTAIILRKFTDVNPLNRIFTDFVALHNSYFRIFMKLYKEDYTMTQALIEKITTLCRKKGVSVNQMALEAGVNKSFVDNLKKGSFPSADKLL